MPDGIESNHDTSTNLRLKAAVLAHREYMLLLTMLRQQVASGELAEDDFAALLYILVAEDLAGDSWTYAPESGSWFKIDADEWVEGEPRGPLLLALPEDCEQILAGVSAELARIETAVRAEHRQATAGCVTLADEHSPKACRHCGSRLQAGLKFCTQCGTPVPAASAVRCANCGAVTDAASSYCVKCGAPLPDAG
jgi:hypothetical protein